MSRPVLAEALGTSLLLYVIVGSGIAAETLSNDPGLQLFAHAMAVGIGLAALIVMMQTVSGSHFNPSVTLAFWRAGAIGGSEATRYVVAQVSGAFVGVLAANWSFGQSLMSVSTTPRSGISLIFSEAVVTFVLVLLIVGLVRSGRGAAIPLAVGGWIAAAVFATSSTGFANPAVTIGRVLTDTYTGIAPGSVPGFLLAQTLAGVAAARVAGALFTKSVRQQSTV